MSRTAIVAGVAALTVGAAVLLPMPAQSSAPLQPPSFPPLAKDYAVPAPGTPKTKMPWDVKPRGSTTYKRGLYDIHVFVVATEDGPEPWDEAEARQQVSLVDDFFNDVTNGLFRVRLASFGVLPPYPGRLCGVPDAMAHAAPEVEAIQVAPDATDALPVIVGRWPDSCFAAGMAWAGSPGTWLGINPEWGRYNLKTFVHEIGHNFGLVHAGAVPRTFTDDPWPSLSSVPTEEEYGDGSDVMGRGGQSACDYASCTFNMSGMNGHNRNILGAVSPDRISSAAMTQAGDDSEVFTLASEESGQPGVQLLYLPWRNRSMFSVEYRAALGRDRHIDDEYGPGAGVHVRLLGSRISEGPAPYPEQSRELTDSVAFPSATWAGEEYINIPIGFKSGQSALLPDGTMVEILSAAGSEASVRVSRPADTTPPSMGVPRIGYAGGACTRYPCTVPASVGKKGKYRVLVDFGSYDDDQWVAFARVDINGAGVMEYQRPEPDGTDEATPLTSGARDWGMWKTYGPGTLNVTYTYRDLAGNEGTSTYQVVLPKPKARR